MVVISGFTGPWSATDPVALQAAPLDRPDSIKGGPFSAGTFKPSTGVGHFGLVEVDDRGEKTICVTFTGLTHENTQVLRLECSVPAP